MKGAAAALAGALLFFLGVLTGAQEGGRLAPPPAIRLGDAPATPAATDGAPGGPETPAPADPPPAPPPGEAPDAGSEAGGSGAGPVEEVEGRVECVDTGQPGAGEGGGAGQDGCPPGQTRRPEPPGQGPAEPPGQEKEAGDGGR